jgi:D-threo-aldose 1-dehydrogenase
MLAGRYTLLEQDSLDDVLPAAQEHGKSVVAVGVFNSGLLSRPRPAPDAKFDYADAPQDLVERAHRIADVCERHGTTLPAAAVAFPLAHPSVVNVTLGMRTAAQVQRNAALLATPVPAQVWSELREAGLLRPDAPVPATAG